MRCGKKVPNLCNMGAFKTLISIYATIPFNIKKSALTKSD